MPKLDDRILQIGREIFARVSARSAFPSPLGRIDDALMNLAMRDPAVKSQLFRFVDCLPTLGTSAAVAAHLRQYLQPIASRLSLPLRLALSDGLFSPLIAAAANFNVRRMARKFIAAPDLHGAIHAIARLRNRRLAFTVDLLGEAVISESEADQYQRRYLELAQSLARNLAALPEDSLIDRDAAGPIPRAGISLKLSALHSQFDPLNPVGTADAVSRRLRPILRAARKSGAFLNFDMEQSAFKELTIHIFKSILMEDEFHDWADVGIAIQAYLRSTLDDLNALAEWSGRRGTSVAIRLVKGAYWDFETVLAAQNGWPVPVFTDKAATDANFESAAAFLIEQRHLLRPAIASHNIRSIAAALAHAESFGARPAEIEFQMLFGMADPIKAALVEMNHRVRVYAPVGELLPGMAYLVRRLLENTSNESFLRAGFTEHAPEEQLLMNPVLRIRPPSSSPRPAADFAGAPPSDFSRQPTRMAMSRAIVAFAAEPCADYPLMIAGRRITTGRWIESLNPSYKSRVVGRCACASGEHADQAVAAAKSAFADWRDVPADDRAALLDRVAEILQRDRFDLAAIEIAECAKPWRDADADIVEAIDFCRYYAWQMRRISSPRGVDLPGEQNQWLYESRGPVVVIAPWNFPLAILTGMAAAAVVAGNPVILKPAEQSPVIAWRLAKAFEEAGAPIGVVNYLPGIGEEIGPVLIAHPDVALIAFTGSRAVGLSINRLAADPLPDQDHVKRVIVEMGGKNAIIVDDDADLDEAIADVVASTFGYSGQKCSACSRVVVLAGVYDALLARLVQAVASLKIAPAEDPACAVGPVIDAQALDRIHAAIERGKRDAHLVFAGDVGPLAAEGFFVAPHVFAEVPPASPLAREEIFGPVLSVMKADDLDHALAIANGVQYALTGGIFSRSPTNIQRARREFRVGNLYINRKITGALVGRQPFGGFKLSGGGTQAGGPDYLRHFLLPRCITENTLRHGFPADVRPGE
ncbi:MAG: proline dehydrogenase family protein [Tepidisphaeraceae bacterium]|jgi:RHH-type proline utilization regulon transcriptional repressor/proline dehydrogenase/delta 1-pyrroline-5-carboxylate dehydrogenase